MAGYPTLPHNTVCDFTAEVLSEVCTDVYTERTLQPGIIDKNISRMGTKRLNVMKRNLS